MKLVLSSDQAKYIETKSALETLDSKTRVIIASKKFGIFFGMALASVPIPIFHFILVPTFLLTSVLMGLKAYKTLFRLQFYQKPQCLVCQKELKANYLLGEELRLKCDKCFSTYIVEEK